MQKKICDNCGKKFDKNIYPTQKGNYICYDCLELKIGISKLFDSEEWEDVKDILSKEGIDLLVLDKL